VAHVALNVGVADQAHFTKRFKLLLGYTIIESIIRYVVMRVTVQRGLPFIQRRTSQK